MLPLEHPRWATLRHAYGSAEDVPDMLRAVAADPTSEPAWEHIWSALCHQTDVHGATYAAIPHLVAIAGNSAVPTRFDFLHFVGYAAACAALPNADPVPPDLRGAYEHALHDCRRLVGQILPDDMSTENGRLILAVLAALLGDPGPAHVLFDIDIPVECPSCGTEVVILDSNVNPLARSE